MPAEVNTLIHNSQLPCKWQLVAKCNWVNFTGATAASEIPIGVITTAAQTHTQSEPGNLPVSQCSTLSSDNYFGCLGAEGLERKTRIRRRNSSFNLHQSAFYSSGGQAAQLGETKM
ncbi:hypothetical protein ILYODFUR_031366 [Ilyodon furcidens]|uniref:Uncharacterized protein n=1 Tax=Ilyodon furcidens TaxID=33524 RepID=A0ABV0T1U8_9TELE